MMSAFLSTTIYRPVAALHVTASQREFAVAPICVTPSLVSAPALEMQLTETAQSVLPGISISPTKTCVSSACAQVEVMCAATVLTAIKQLQCSLISHSCVLKIP